MIVTVTNLVKTYDKKNDKINALTHYKQAEQLGIQIGAKNELKLAYEGLAKIYDGQKDYANAFNYQRLFTAIKDTLYNIEADKKLTSLQFDFDIQKKQGEINYLTQEKKLQESSLKKEKLLRYGLLLGLAMVFFIAYTQWKHSVIRQKANKQLEIQKIKTEAEKEKAESALDELKQTQAQLIQSEKMASLGQLTAGIAHEIQNPLNFITNFSALNYELIEEMKKRIESGEYQDAMLIAKDIAENEQKIIYHGKRTDSFVKGILQHSRSNSGKKESTDINKLAEEFLSLAYHGMRGMNKSFNARIITHFDQNLHSINVIPQDIGRVILNLITNAFYAVNEKKKIFPDQYEPTVTVSTKMDGKKNLIIIQDNGTGIPQNILDNIFEPFFTTKPNGEGTGLGLSLSYDIVKAHGGELKIETKEGEGTSFIIVLP